MSAVAITATSAATTTSDTAYTYDQLGRISASTQTTNGQPSYPFNYTYNLAAGLTQEKYPSGRTVSYFFDTAGRVMGASGSAANYAGGACASGQPDTCTNKILYAPHGLISSMPLGNGITESWVFNNRLQPLQMQAGTLLTLGFGYSATLNNGNLAGQTIQRGAQTWTQAYAYDTLNQALGGIATQGGSFQGVQENGMSLQTYG